MKSNYQIACDARDFIKRLLNNTEAEASDLLTNYGEDVEAELALLVRRSRKVGDANTQPEAVQLPQSSDPVLLSLPKNPAFHGSRDCDGNGQTNERRAQRAYTALLSYIGTDRLDDTYDTHLQDLLNDLMHLACRENLDFNDALRSAASNYKEEK